MPAAITAQPHPMAASAGTGPRPMRSRAAQGSAPKEKAHKAALMKVPRPNGCSPLVAATWARGMRLVMVIAADQPMAAPVIP
jgi:hypothetical protein